MYNVEKQEFQVGDTIYCIDEDYRRFEDKAIQIYLQPDGLICYTGDDGWDFWREDIGKTVFKTETERGEYYDKTSF